jgi:hypothetical protein
VSDFKPKIEEAKTSNIAEFPLNTGVTIIVIIRDGVQMWFYKDGGPLTGEEAHMRLLASGYF